MMYVFALYKIIFCFFFLSYSGRFVSGVKPPVKNGFYKIISVTDGSVLTVTNIGRPRQVITDAWENKDTQHWKVKSKTHGGFPLQLIRNEKIRDNEVTKEDNYGTGKNQNDFVPVDWSFLPDPKRRPNTFALNNGIGCLSNRGQGNRVSIYEECDESSEQELWRFEFLYDIPKPGR